MEVLHGLPQGLAPWHSCCVQLCEANGDFADAEARVGSPTHLRQHPGTKRKGHIARPWKNMRRVGRAAKAEAVAGLQREGCGEHQLPTWTASSHPRARWFGASSTASSNNRWFRTYLAVVIDARVSRKVGRDINKRIIIITSRWDRR